MLTTVCLSGSAQLQQKLGLSRNDLRISTLPRSSLDSSWATNFWADLSSELNRRLNMVLTNPAAERCARRHKEARLLCACTRRKT